MVPFLSDLMMIDGDLMGFNAINAISWYYVWKVVQNMFYVPYVMVHSFIHLFIYLFVYLFCLFLE